MWLEGLLWSARSGALSAGWARAGAGVGRRSLAGSCGALRGPAQHCQAKVTLAGPRSRTA